LLLLFIKDQTDYEITFNWSLPHYSWRSRLYDVYMYV